MFDEKELRQYDRWGKARPTSDPHGTPEEIRANMKRAVTSNWRLEGNVLHADSDFGPIVQTIDPGYICKGTDDEGLPILVKLDM